MSRRHADNWSHPGHYLVDPYTWPYLQMVTVMVMNDLLPHPLCNVNRPSHSEIQLFQNLTMKIHGQGHVCGPRSRSHLTFKFQRSRLWSRSNPLVMCVVKGQGHVWPSNFKGQDYGQGQTHWSHLRPGVQTIYFLFVSWQSDQFWLRYRKFHIWPWKFKVKVMAKVKPDGHIWGLWVQSICLLNVPWQSDHFWLRYSKFHIWPWKFKIKVMVKVKPDGHIWAQQFNRYVCFSFRGNQTIFGWDIANSIFYLEKSRPRSRRKSTKI